MVSMQGRRGHIMRSSIYRVVETQTAPPPSLFHAQYRDQNVSSRVGKWFIHVVVHTHEILTCTLYCRQVYVSPQKYDEKL